MALPLKQCNLNEELSPSFCAGRKLGDVEREKIGGRFIFPSREVLQAIGRYARRRRSTPFGLGCGRKIGMVQR